MIVLKLHSLSNHCKYTSIFIFKISHFFSCYFEYTLYLISCNMSSMLIIHCSYFTSILYFQQLFKMQQKRYGVSIVSEGLQWQFKINTVSHI